MDMNKLNETTCNHSIIVIQDTFAQYPNRYLVYLDERWGCRLFLNYRTSQNNEASILSRLSRDLKVSSDSIQLTYRGRRMQEKYSVSAKRQKMYCHEFYGAVLCDFPPALREDSFQLDGRQYFWMSVSEMEQDKMIQENNMDVVKTVEELF